MTELLGRHLGGLLPLVGVEREVHIVDGATYKLDVTWLRRRVGLEYHSPRIPRGIQRIRDRELTRVRAVAEEALARGDNE